MGGTIKSWEESYKKAAIMVNKMSLLEKVNVTTGIGWSSGLCVVRKNILSKGLC